MLKPGTLINDRYEIIERIGSGGMANVYKAKCHKLNRCVAVKVLKTEFSADKNFVKRFRDEAQACAGLSHPNIVNVYDVGTDGDTHYIVMELVEGITLKEYIEKKGKLEVKESLGIAIQIARGMEAAHRSHIVHRDIKPQNVILSKDGKVKVTDFGIAKAINSNTITVDTMGSVHYLSPEQARGGYSDEKSDIYSLGVTMYEMLSGKVPFNGDNTVSVALLHIQSEPIALRELDPEIPVSVERIVQKCMQKKPERRYLTSTDLIKDLKKSIDDPNGNFVVLSTTGEINSPTINMSDEELELIKSSSNQVGNVGGGYNMKYDDDNNYFDDLENDYDEFDEYDEYEDEFDSDTDLDEFPEEDADEIDPRMEKVGLIGTIIAALIVGLVVIFLLSRFFNSFPGVSDDDNLEISPTPEITMEVSPTPEEVEMFSMPYVINLTLDDATKLIEQRAEDAIIKPTEEYSDSVDRGLVIEQYPSEGTEISVDTEIRLVISAGKEAFQLPSVVDYTDGQAVTVLTDAGLNVIRDYQAHESIEEDKVITTSPEPNSLVVKGDTITVIVSTGPDTVYVPVPQLVGLNESTVRSLIAASGLSVGEVTREHSPEEKGTVIGQTINPGEEVQENTSIGFTVSEGPEPTPSPTPEPTPSPTPEPTPTPEPPPETEGEDDPNP